MKRHRDGTASSFVHFTGWLILAFLLVLVSPPGVRGQNTLTLQANHIPIDQLTIGDLDFETFGSRNYFFSLIIGSREASSVRLNASIDIELADGTTYSPAATLTTRYFDVPALPEQKIITNLDIGPTTQIKTDRFSFISEAKERIRQLALSTGKLPAGRYVFHLEVEDTNTAVARVSKDIELELVNITRLDLILPQNRGTVPTPFPLFQWIYDGDSVEVAVFEKTSQHPSNEEAASGTPFLSIRSGSPLLATGASTFQYPTAGVRALEEGKTYVWKVRGLTRGSGGSGPSLNSEIWQFTVSASGGGDHHESGGDQGDGELVLREIRYIPGVSQEILNQLLDGTLRFTGVVTVDGQTFTPAQLTEFLASLGSDPDRIISIQVID